MFGVNSYAKIKSVENKGNYTNCKITISKKNKQTDKYELSFSATVRFVGDAHLQKPMEGQRIKITSCGVSNAYVKNDVVEYPKNPTYVVFGYELQSDSSSSGATVSAPVFEVNSEELPF